MTLFAVAMCDILGLFEYEAKIFVATAKAGLFLISVHMRHPTILQYVSCRSFPNASELALLATLVFFDWATYRFGLVRFLIQQQIEDWLLLAHR